MLKYSSWFFTVYNVALVCCMRLMRNSPASEFYVPTYRNTLSVPPSQADRYEEIHSSYLLAYEDWKECSETSAYKIQKLILHTYPPMKMEKTDCSETSEYKIQNQWNYPEESTQLSEHGESLKSRTFSTQELKSRIALVC